MFLHMLGFCTINILKQRSKQTLGVLECECVGFNMIYQNPILLMINVAFI